MANRIRLQPPADIPKESEHGRFLRQLCEYINRERHGELTTADYSIFEDNGFIAHAGAARYWRDVDFPIIIRTTGVGIPTLEILNGNITAPQWQVNDTNQCESQEFVHEWAEGTDAYWHIHLTTNGTDVTDRYVRFSVEYGYVTPEGVWVWPAVLDSGDILIPANTPNETMKIVSLGHFTPAGVKIAGHAIGLLKRIASTGTAPTNNPWVSMLQMHILCDTPGSRQMVAK